VAALDTALVAPCLVGERAAAGDGGGGVGAATSGSAGDHTQAVSTTTKQGVTHGRKEDKIGC
jgi:hypothetical protein